MQESSNTLIKAVVIATRYAAQRLQFSDDRGRELPLIQYQTHVGPCNKLMSLRVTRNE